MQLKKRKKKLESSKIKRKSPDLSSFLVPSKLEPNESRKKASTIKTKIEVGRKKKHPSITLQSPAPRAASNQPGYAEKDGKWIKRRKKIHEKSKLELSE